MSLANTLAMVAAIRTANKAIRDPNSLVYQQPEAAKEVIKSTFANLEYAKYSSTDFDARVTLDVSIP